MPSPKDGKECTLASPIAPGAAMDAHDSTTGKVAEASGNPGTTAPGNQDSTKVRGAKPDPDADGADKTDPTAWLSFSLKDDAGNPVPNEPYLVKAPDGTEYPGALDEHGKAKLTGLKPGGCQITFPRIDKDELKKA